MTHVGHVHSSRTPASNRSSGSALDAVARGDKTLQSGSRGAAVEELQELLNRRGAALTTDGDFGPKTAAAVRAFQRSHGLEPDGVVGPRTLGKLRADRPAGNGGDGFESGGARGSRFLDRGDRGQAVENLEKRLKGLGYNPGAVDGVFDAQTQAAVKKFQQAQNLAADGVVGPQTRARLDDPKGSGPTLREGERGPAVRELQQRLRQLGHDPGPADGVFGNKTEQAVKAFQRSHGLTADGVVGPKTWDPLGVVVKGGSTGGAGGVSPGASNSAKLQYAMNRARQLGLTITSTTGGTHTPGSYHYRGRAADVAGPPHLMAQFYREMAQLRPTELFYDPLGGIKNGQQIGAIGGHGDHVHVAF